MKHRNVFALFALIFSISASATQLSSHGQWVALYGGVSCTWATSFLATQGLSPAPAAQQPFPGVCAAGFSFEKMLDTKFVSGGGSFDFSTYYWAILVNNPSGPPAWYFFEFRADALIPLQKWKNAIGYSGTDYKVGDIKWDVALDTYSIANGLETIGQKKMVANKPACSSGCTLIDVTFGATPAGGFQKGSTAETPSIVTPKHLGTHNLVSSTAQGLQYTRPYNAGLGDAITYLPGSAVAQIFGSGSFAPIFWTYMIDLNVAYPSYGPF